MQIESSLPVTQDPRSNFRRWLRSRGLRWKFNALLLPVIALTVLLLVLLDYNHEWRAIMAAHGQHAAPIGADVAAASGDSATSPEAVARRALAIHAVYALVLLLLVGSGVNIALWRFVLRPIDRIRERIEHMERGHWRMSVQPVGYDEVGRVVESFQMLGLKVDALVMQLLRAERLGTLALLAKQTAARIEPSTRRIDAAISHLRQSGAYGVREATEDLATANAEVVAAVRSLSQPFELVSAKPGRPGTMRGVRPPAHSVRSHR